MLWQSLAWKLLPLGPLRSGAWSCGLWQQVAVTFSAEPVRSWTLRQSLEVVSGTQPCLGCSMVALCWMLLPPPPCCLCFVLGKDPRECPLRASSRQGRPELGKLIAPSHLCGQVSLKPGISSPASKDPSHTAPAALGLWSHKLMGGSQRTAHPASNHNIGNKD